MATAKEQLDAVLAKMVDPFEDTAANDNVTGIIYGDNGGGKTIEAIKLAKAITAQYGGRILMVDAVNAWRSLKNHPELQGGIVRVPYEGKSQLEIITQAIEFKQPGFDDIKVVILDELSSMTDKDGDVLLAARAAADAQKDPDVLTQPDMGATTERMRRVMIAMLKLPISVIMVAHQRQDEDKNVGYKVTRPRFMPKFSGTIREGLDFVVHMTADESHREGNKIYYSRKVQTAPTRTVVAKSRVGGLDLYESGDRFVEGVIKWMKGEAGDSQVTVVVDDVPPDVGSDDSGSDFSTYVVD